MKNLSWAESKQDLAMAIYALPNDAPRTQPEQELNSILIDRAKLTYKNGEEGAEPTLPLFANQHQ